MFCPNCGNQNLDLASHCKDCSAPLPMAHRPVEGSPGYVRRAEQAAMMCSIHPERAASGVCSYSGKLFCGDDLVEVNNRLYAKQNLGYVMNEARDQASNRQQQPVVYMTPGVAIAPTYPHMMYSNKSRVAAGLLGIFLGGFGVHRFYLGFAGIGIIQLFLTLFTGIGVIWGFIEGILLLVGAMDRDKNGFLLR
jgi:TM2 domain-containing membrane protein YozV